MGVRIKLRRDTSSNFSTANPVLSEGELAYEKNTGRFKLGDGITPWNSLPYLTIAEASEILNRIKNVDGSGSGLDADLLDGQHASAFASATHNHDSTYVKLTDYEDADVLGKIKNVDGSGSGLDADLLDGYHASGDQFSGSWFNRIPIVKSNGIVEIGRYIDFHYSSGETSDYTPRLYSLDNRNLSILTAGGRDKLLVGKTTSDVTIYVDNVNGNDSTGNGSSSSPYATLSRALEEIGDFYSSNITIILKASPNSYGNINISGYIRKVISNSNITISGETSVIASGTITSYSGSVNDPIYGSLVTVSAITDSSKNWNQNEHIFKLIRIYSGSTSYYRIITGNSSNTIYLSYKLGTDITNWNYEILDIGTKCNSIWLYDCMGVVSFKFLRIERSNDGYCVVVRNSSFSNDMSYCFIKAYSGQSNNVFYFNRSHVNITACYVDCNNSTGAAIQTSHLANVVGLYGTIFNNLSSKAILSNYDYSRFLVNDGTRFYKSSSGSPSICIDMISGILTFGNTNGTPLIDSGTTGVNATRLATIQNTGNVVFGPNVTTTYYTDSSCIDGNKFLVSSNLAVGETYFPNIHSTILCKGSFGTNVSVVSSNTTLGSGHHTILANATNSNINITLPSASGCTGRQYVIRRIDTNYQYTVNVIAQSGQTIDGSSSISLTNTNKSIYIISDGSNWRHIVFSGEGGGSQYNYDIYSGQYLDLDKFSFDSTFTGADGSVAFSMIPCISFSPYNRGRIHTTIKNVFPSGPVSFKLWYALEGIQNNANIIMEIGVYGLNSSGLSFITSDTFTIGTGTSQTGFYNITPNSPTIPQSAISNYNLFAIYIDRRSDLEIDTYDGYFKLIDVNYVYQQ
ncbi:MAG: hypothetical protein QXD03_02400 [Candidatus Anstonellales archaeon]